MRTLKLQVQTSVDGFMAGPNGEMDWMTLDWGDDLNRYIDAITQPVDTIVLGRHLAEGFIPHWQGVAADPDNPEVETGKLFTDTPKVVFSHTLTTSPWDNTRVTNNLPDDIYTLKQQDGGDIITYGGSEFVSSLIQHQLIDEFHLFVNPVALGTGMPIFQMLASTQNLSLSRSQMFDCGIVVLCYQLVHDAE